MFSDDAYNKDPEGHGTLVANWAEEHALREATGQGRSVAQRHVPRSGLLQDFTKTPTVVRKGDNTFARVHGPRSGHQTLASSTVIGQPDPHAGKIVRTGPRELALAGGRMDFAEAEVQAEEAEEAQQANVRRFDTTTGVTHSKPDEHQVEKAVHGRRSYEAELLRGPAPDRTLALSNDGLDVNAHAHYSNADTITHARMCLADSRMRSDLKASAGTGVHSFGKNAEFTKPILEFTRGLGKDEEMQDMFHGLKYTQPQRSSGGPQPRGPSEVPSLTMLKTTLHDKIAQVWGAYGYVALRQRLFDVGDHEGFVQKAEVVSIFREQLGLDPQEASDAALDVYLSQLVTMKKTELRIGSLMSSLRPILAQKEKRRVLEAFKALQPVNGQVRLGDWLSQLQDNELRATIVSAFGAQEEEQIVGMPLTEQVFLELVADLAPFMDIGAVLA